MEYEEYLRIYRNALNEGDPDKSLTLDAWQRRAIITRSALQEIRKQYDRDIEELAHTYQPEPFNEKRKPLDETYGKFVELAKERVRDDLSRVMQAKRKQLDKCLDAPSEESVRLLTVLQMRTDLTPADVAAVAQKLNGNIQSLRALASIAERAGISFPTAGSVEEIEQNFDHAEQYAAEMIETIDRADSEFQYLDRCFWTAPGSGEAPGIFGPLDDSTFTAPQTAETDAVTAAQAAAKQGASKASSHNNAARVFLRGDETLAGIAMQFGTGTAAIRRANPDVDLDQLQSGMSIVVPSTRLRITNEPGSIIAEQVIPTYYEPQKTSHAAGAEVDITEA